MTRNFIIARDEEEALEMAKDDSSFGTGFETLETAKRNLADIKLLERYLPPRKRGRNIYYIWKIEHRVWIVSGDSTEL